MKSLQEFIAENLEKLVLTTAQKENPVDENGGDQKTVAENADKENVNQETEK